MEYGRDVKMANTDRPVTERLEEQRKLLECIEEQTHQMMVKLNGNSPTMEQTVESKVPCINGLAQGNLELSEVIRKRMEYLNSLL